MHATWEFLKKGAEALSAIIALLALFVSAASLAYVTLDRRIKLVVRARKGDWYVLDPAFGQNETLFRGVLEVYNHSARPNSLCGYRFWIENNGVREDLESEMVRISSPREEKDETPQHASKDERYNVSPLTVAPYSGIEVNIHAIIKGKHVLLQEFLPITVEVEDVFGKRYQAIVHAKRSARLIERH